MTRSKVRRALGAFGSSALLAAACVAQGVQVHKVEQSPEVKDAPVRVGGRVVALSASDGAGANEAAVGTAYVAQWPGAHFATSFQGREVYFRIGKAHEILHVMVDGAAPVVVADPQPGMYGISGLPSGWHNVEVAVATESQGAPNVFGGFAVPKGERTNMPPAPKRQIEFIGDSHTVGYGNTSPKGECTDTEVWETTDNTQAFGALTAAHYGAAFQVNAISGRGVVRNYNGTNNDTLPQAYPYVLLNKQQMYRNPDWQPEVLVIALGTNDFSMSLHAGEHWVTREQLHADFEATYAAFLKQLRSRYPRAYMVVWATNMADGEIEAEAKAAVDRVTAAGEKRIAFLPFDDLEFRGCAHHPSLKDDAEIRDRLMQVIDAVPGVWQGK